MNFIERMKSNIIYGYFNYKKAVENNEKEKERFVKCYKDTKSKLDDELKKGENADIKQLRDLRNDLQKWYYEFNKCKLKKEFLRPNKKDEIIKRDQIASTFADELLDIVGEDSSLRFHGTPIYFAKEIIKSGNISSTPDRYDGYIRSSDVAGYISATTINNIDLTINYYTDFASYNRFLPCGVLFVLNEKDGDYELRDRSEMQNINFNENPEQLVGILCTDEVKNMVIKWCINYNMDSDKVFTFNEFLEYAKNNNLEHKKSI